MILACVSKFRIFILNFCVLRRLTQSTLFKYAYFAYAHTTTLVASMHTTSEALAMYGSYTYVYCTVHNIMHAYYELVSSVYTS